MSKATIDWQATLDELTSQQQMSQQSLETLKSLESIEVGETPHRCIFQVDKVRLLHYPALRERPKNDNRETKQPGAAPVSHDTPLLLVYALVNRPYILDIEPERSLIRRLLEQGLDVYLIDWGYPDGNDRFVELQDYLCHYLHQCIEQTAHHARSTQVDLLGICQGGTFSLCYTAMFPERVRRLATLVTPVDFQTNDNLLSHLVQEIDIDLAVDTLGNIPGPLVAQNFNALKPMQLGLQKMLNLPHRLHNPPSAVTYLRMERWQQDCPDQAGETFRQFIKAFFQENRLVNGGLKIGNRDVCLGKIQQPVMNIYGTQDHLVPPSASRALRQLVRSASYRELALTAGHIGLFVSPKTQKILATELADWLCSQPS